jgi:S-adenosylmethionine/arginine decarboxylase-like enzyme
MTKMYEQGFMTKILAEDCQNWMLDSIPQVESLLRHVCGVIDMEPLAGPFSSEVKDIFNRVQDDGISSVLMITTSHLAAHCWSQDKSVRLVIDSCKPYSVALIISLLNDVLKPKSIRVAKEVWV